MSRRLSPLLLLCVIAQAPTPAEAQLGQRGRAHATRRIQPARPAPTRVLGARFGRRPTPPLPPGPGHVERHVIGGREVQVYLPPGYQQGASDYPVLVLQDGQDVFGAGPKRVNVDLAVEAEARAGRAQPVVVVAVTAPPTHEERVKAYAKSLDPSEGVGGGGREYIDFVVKDLLPWAQRRYRLRPGRRHTAIGGYSIGARIALEAALDHPEVFGKVLAQSPSTWFNDRELVRRVEAATGPGGLPELEIYLDSGASGFKVDDHQNTQDLRDALLARGFRHGTWSQPAADRRSLGRRLLWHWLEPAHEHGQAAWRERFPRALQVMFPAP